MVMDRIALLLTIIGGINWGSVGLFRFDLVAWLFGGQTATVSRVIYTLVGLSALMTTTLPAMEETVRVLNTLPNPPAMMLGGAVVTAEYAESLGCYHAKDAKASVEIAKRILG